MKRPGIILILLFISLLSFAQIERVPTKRTDSAANNAATNSAGKAGKKDLVKELGLTREQKIKLKEIRQSNKAKKDSIDNNEQLSETEKKTQLQKLQKENIDSILAILTEEQREKLKAKRKEARKAKN